MVITYWEEKEWGRELFSVTLQIPRRVSRFCTICTIFPTQNLIFCPIESPKVLVFEISKRTKILDATFHTGSSFRTHMNVKMLILVIICIIYFHRTLVASIISKVTQNNSTFFDILLPLWDKISNIGRKQGEALEILTEIFQNIEIY